MTFGFSFQTGSGTLIQNASSDASFGAFIKKVRVPHKVLTRIDFSEATGFTDYYVTWIWTGTMTAYDDFGPFTPSPTNALLPPTITVNKTSKYADVYWDVRSAPGDTNPYHAVYTCYIDVTVIGT